MHVRRISVEDCRLSVAVMGFEVYVPHCTTGLIPVIFAVKAILVFPVAERFRSAYADIETCMYHGA